jgi:hypothetical protein
MIIAIPIEIVSRDFGYAVINVDVTKMVIMSARAKYRNLNAIDIGLVDLENCTKFVNKRGRKSKGIATVGSITNVIRAMAAVGSPRPRNPFTMPEIKNVIIKKTIINGSVVGSIKERNCVKALRSTSNVSCKSS